MRLSGQGQGSSGGLAGGTAGWWGGWLPRRAGQAQQAHRQLPGGVHAAATAGADRLRAAGQVDGLPRGAVAQPLRDLLQRIQHAHRFARHLARPHSSSGHRQASR